MRISLILSLVISLLAVAFALVNNETVAVNIGDATVEGSLCAQATYSAMIMEEKPSEAD